MWFTIINFFMRILDKFPFQLKRSDLDRKSPNYCDKCHRMSMVLIHSGVLYVHVNQTTKKRDDFYHGLFYCRCDKLRAVPIEAEKMSPPKRYVKFVKELKDQKVIVEKPDGLVTYHPELYHQDS